jgi:hypothetical protein
MRASYKGHAEVVKVLLAAGIDKTVAWVSRLPQVVLWNGFMC